MLKQEPRETIKLDVWISFNPWSMMSPYMS